MDSQNMVIGVMRLFGGEWMKRKPLGLDGGDSFGDGAGIPIACRLVARPAFIADVLNAIKADSVQPALSGPS